ncbi:2-polyprenyl-3-methyl-6-methoxy-1,4-benzoquinone monooxygenase [uncultured Cocleimonas sp.]|uniref:2-polyprenyl-3-methyl-6-methoxy-1,4-benzoquinone monooxygenase n=1 Tax=uncultured Cocleimonas sp. TaxID=1051587 RepID=UPI00261513ED|nr:2-polyprenyl-3-methyl-6-methoxy-1,4-benzoquinone monooxygenase [uncultured Cocleimonas sp.]
MRTLNLVDRLLHEVDQALRTVHTLAPTTDRPNPSAGIADSGELSEDDRKKAVSLMRINHAGEISAQGLYRGQALMSKSEEIKQQMNISAMEENDHLNWCEKRLDELGSHKSYLSPVWYLGSLGIGAAAGVAGDKWSLGFVKETEDQVVRHLDSHLEKLPEGDHASRAILTQMKIDEEHHADVAVEAGAADLPFPIKKILMPILSNVMTKASARI